MTASASRSSPGPHSTTGVSPHASRRNDASSPKRSGGQRLFGHAAPALISAKRPVRRDPPPQLVERGDGTSASGNRISSSSTPTARSSRRFFRMTCPPSASCASRIERARGLLAQVPDREPDDPRRARRAREHRRLHQPLEIDRDVVGRPPQRAERPPSIPPSVGRLERHGAIDGRHEIDDARGASRRRASRCRAAGNAWRSAAAAGTAWTTSPSAPSRTMRMFMSGPRMRARQIARRVILGIADDGDAAAVAADGLALGHGVDGVVGPLAVHVGLQREQQRRDRRLGEDDDVVDAAQRGDELGAIGGGQERPVRPLRARRPTRSSLMATTRRSASRAAAWR